MTGPGRAGVVAVNLHGESPKVTVAAAMMPVAAPSCTPQPVEDDATDVAIFFRGDDHRVGLETALEADPRVATRLFESSAQAYETFRTRWADNADLLAAVTADQFPSSFRLRLTTPSQYPVLRADYAAMDGVEQIVGRRCSADAPVGGIR